MENTKMSTPITKETPRELSSIEKIMQRIKYDSTNLHWNNFNQVHPETDRMLLVWCDLGNISQNLYLTYRDRGGGYDMPHPHKNYPVKAWAYVDLPKENEEHLKKITEDVKKEEKEKKEAK